jgi:hypothetical protein
MVYWPFLILSAKKNPGKNAGVFLIMIAAKYHLILHKKHPAVIRQRRRMFKLEDICFMLNAYPNLDFAQFDRKSSRCQVKNRLFRRLLNPSYF